jgi:polysaccharide biosynthesis/export protein
MQYNIQDANRCRGFRESHRGMMMRTAMFPVLVAVAALTVCTAQGQKNKKAAPAQPAAAQETKDSDHAPDITQEYVIGPEDVISILVYDQPQFNITSQSVRPDGFITMPLLGEVKATGKAPKDLGDEIAKMLAEKYLKLTPQVMVRVDAVNSRYYQINGGVNKPGKYPLLVPTTIMQALVNAGGFHEFANTKKINLLRDNKVFVVFNYNDAIKGKHPEKNVYLKQGDLIIVRE